MLLARVAILSTLTLLATANPQPNPNPQAAATTSNPLAVQTDTPQYASLSSHLAAYLATKTTDPAYTHAVAAVSSAIPPTALSGISADPTGYLASVITAGGAPEWFSSIPTSDLSVLQSVGSEQIAIATKDLAGPAPTVAAKIGGVVVAAGAAALAVL